LQELLILREFVEHLQQNRHGANPREIEAYTAAWTVDDVTKLPEELRSCCVCLEEVCQGNCVRTLPCLHTFHSDCAVEWLKRKKTCPLCQFAIDGGVDVGQSSTEPVVAGGQSA
jgi:E3 ubiquitin-protein ligase SDIR1